MGHIEQPHDERQSRMQHLEQQEKGKRGYKSELKLETPAAELTQRESVEKLKKMYEQQQENKKPVTAAPTDTVDQRSDISQAEKIQKKEKEPTIDEAKRELQKLVATLDVGQSNIG